MTAIVGEVAVVGRFVSAQRDLVVLVAAEDLRDQQGTVAAAVSVETEGRCGREH